MRSYDLCIAWNWEHDAAFVRLLDMACHSHGLSLLQITPDNLMDVLKSLANNQISFQAFFDRASEADVRFMPVVQWARDHAVYYINPHEQARRTWDKATMHLDFISAGLYTPYTIILPSHHEQSALPLMDLSPLGDRFTIKPAHGSGGEGVVLEATSFSQVLEARQEYPADRYLLQAHIVPTRLGSRRAWFRVIYCAGQVYPCWWDTHTHVYAPVTFAEESCYGLTSLRSITASIARISRLEFFSTEIALTSDGLFTAVDYVNDPIDLRLQSEAFDGVPDDIVQDIAERLVTLVAAHCPPKLQCLPLGQALDEHYKVIDYDKIASEYARHRQVHPKVLRSLLLTSQVGSASKVLEVGCGTGNYIVALETVAGSSCWGIDPSEQMLSRARERSRTIRFQSGQAERLGFPSDFFDLVFSVDVIHHVDDRLAYFREAYRVLRAGGKGCTVTDSEWIIHHRQPLAVYFPETVEIELGRYPRIAELRDIMERVGFGEVTENTVEFAYQLTDIQAYRDRAFSALRLIPEAAFQRGIERMEQDLHTGPIQCVSRYLLLWGTK